MACKIYDVVTAVEALPESGIHVGMIGTIVDVYPDGKVEVEFCGENGETIAMVPLRPSQIALEDIHKAASKVSYPAPMRATEDATLENLEDAASRWERSVGYFESGFDCLEEYTHDLFERECLHGVLNGSASLNLAVPDALKTRIEAADKRFVELTFEVEHPVWGGAKEYDKIIFWYYYRQLIK